MPARPKPPKFTHAPVASPGFRTRRDGAPTVATQIRLDADLFEKFRLKCFTSRQSMSLVIETLVRDWVARQ